jgi:hypothetical protein
MISNAWRWHVTVTNLVFLSAEFLKQRSSSPAFPPSLNHGLIQTQESHEKMACQKRRTITKNGVSSEFQKKHFSHVSSKIVTAELSIFFRARLDERLPEKRKRRTMMCARTKKAFVIYEYGNEIESRWKRCWMWSTLLWIERRSHSVNHILFTYFVHIFVLPIIDRTMRMWERRRGWRWDLLLTLTLRTC